MSPPDFVSVKSREGPSAYKVRRIRAALSDFVSVKSLCGLQGLQSRGISGRRSATFRELTPAGGFSALKVQAVQHAVSDFQRVNPRRRVQFSENQAKLALIDQANEAVCGLTQSGHNSRR